MSTPQILEMNVTHGNQTHVLRFPEGGNILEHIRAILQGQEYPAIQPQIYTPTVIVDVGANVGAFALQQTLLFPDARIHCFGPGPEAHPLLAQNMASFPNVSVYPWGLYDDDRAVKFYAGFSNIMQGSIFPSGETADTTSEIEMRHAGREFARLGIDHISVLKIDTEGAELPILRACGSLLDTVDQLHVEYHAETDRREIDALLGNRFTLARCRADYPERGTSLYLARSFMQRHPACNPYALNTN